MKSIFSGSGEWYKGMLHVHTTESDGSVSPEHVLKAYRNMGYDFICPTDHWKVTPKPKKSGSRILHIPGVELDGGTSGVGDFHFVGIDVKPGSRFHSRGHDKNLTPRDMVDAILAEGGLPVLAHPSWNGVSWVDMIDVADDLFGLEVWNTGCDVEIGRGQSDVQWDDLLSRGYRIMGLAVDDSHRFYRDAMKAWVMVRATSLTRKAIRSALEKGRFYSSTGPSILEIRYDRKSISVKTSPVRRIDLVASPRRGDTVESPEGMFLTEHTFSIPKSATYVRIRIRDAVGRFAWSNPIYFG